MNILFLTKNKLSASYIFYKKSLELLNNSDNEITISFDYPKDNKDYKRVDYVFFMGGSIEAKKIKSFNKYIKCAVIDSRSGHKDSFDQIDLIISNGLENYLFHLNKDIKSIIYPTYPSIKLIEKKSTNNKKILLGYHGNKIHLEAFKPIITKALKNLSKIYDIELWAMYNLKDLGKTRVFNKYEKYFKFRHIQYSEENYNNYLAKVDIGLVPQLIPQKDNFFTRIFTTGFKRYNQSSSDYILRFKDTTNLGRHFIFSQLKIPIISDITPSSLSFIRQGENGYLAYSSKNWEDCISMLIEDPLLRKKMGSQSFEDWKNNYSHHILNNKLLEILKTL